MVLECTGEHQLFALTRTPFDSPGRPAAPWSYRSKHGGEIEAVPQCGPGHRNQVLRRKSRFSPKPFELSVWTGGGCRLPAECWRTFS
jgi:hypothetical protein